MDNLDLFNRVIDELNRNTQLENIILIGSWTLHIYRYALFHESIIPIIRTNDLDIMLRNPPRIRNKFNMASLFENIGFTIDFDQTTGLMKFHHPDLTVEFLINRKGAGKFDIINIKELSVSTD